MDGDGDVNFVLSGVLNCHKACSLFVPAIRSLPGRICPLTFFGDNAKLMSFMSF